MRTNPNSGVSIGIPTLNEADHIEGALDSIQASIQAADRNRPTEVIVVDGHSDDDTRSVARGHPVTDRVILEEPLAGGGVISGRVNAIEASSSPIHVAADADTLYERRWLSALLAPLADPDVALTYGSVRGRGYERGLRELYAAVIGTTFGHYCPGQNRAFRVDAYRAVGGYDLATPQDKVLRTSIEEEVRFPNRMEQVGRVEKVPEAVAWPSGRGMESEVTDNPKSGGVQWDLV